MQKPMRDCVKERKDADARKSLEAEIAAHEEAILEAVAEEYDLSVRNKGGRVDHRAIELFGRVVRIHACIVGLRRSLESLDA